MVIEVEGGGCEGTKLRDAHRCEIQSYLRRSSRNIISFCSLECIDITLMHCKYRLRLSCQGIMQNFQLVRACYARICFVSSFKPRNTLQGKFQESVSAHNEVSSSFKVTEIVGQPPTVCVKDSLTRLLKNGFLRSYFYTCHRDSFFLCLFIACIVQECTVVPRNRENPCIKYYISRWMINQINIISMIVFVNETCFNLANTREAKNINTGE